MSCGVAWARYEVVSCPVWSTGNPCVVAWVPCVVDWEPLCVVAWVPCVGQRPMQPSCTDLLPVMLLLLQYGKGGRFAGQLLDGSRTGLHWDNADLKQELVIRPDSTWCVGRLGLLCLMGDACDPAFGLRSACEAGVGHPA